MATAESLPARVLAHIRRQRLFREPGEALVAVSGGADSAALLHLLNGLRDSLGLSLVVVHVDHGIQSDSQTVGQSVAALAKQYQLPFETTELHLGPHASETEARRARYAWLREVQKRRGAKYIVTAHHEDDQVETIMLRALRGSAPAGLAGISAKSRGGRGLVRPLLPFSRRELADYAAACGLPVHDDPANRDPRHLRSWVRTTLLPLLQERLGPRLRRDLLAKGRHAARDARAWDQMLDLVPDLALDVQPNSFAVARAVLCGYDNALSVALLRAAARRVGLVLGPTRARRLVELARRSSGRRLALGSGWSAEVVFDRLSVSQVVDVDCALERISPSGERGSALFGEFEITWAPGAAPERIERATWTTWLDSAAWEVRAPARGDALVPLGGVGHRPLRRLLMEARVPRRARTRYPVVSRGETILWVPGICRSAEGVPAPGTRAVRLDVIGYGSETETNRRA
jgi:tRNA(Ile)-lysidine synthase